MKVVKFQDRVRDVAVRFQQTYGRRDVISSFGPATTYRQKIEALEALTDETRTRQAVCDIIGNDTWAEMSCDECEAPFDTLVFFGDEPDYDARWQQLCGGCLAAALSLLPQT